MTLRILTDADAPAIRGLVNPALEAIGLPADEDILSDDVGGQAERMVMAADPNWEATLATADAGSLASAARLFAASILAPSALALVPTTFQVGDLRVSVSLPKPDTLAADLAARARAAVAAYVADAPAREIVAFPMFGRAPGGRGRMFRP